MKVVPVLVARFSADWIRVAISSYLYHFPDDRVLVVDNNPSPGEIDWLPLCERERHWLRWHPRLDYLPNPIRPCAGHSIAPHGLGIDAALAWCRDRGADVMIHFEADCLIEGRLWRDNLVRAISAGASMAGSACKLYGPIHPTPSAWRVDQVHTRFGERERTPDDFHSRLCQLFPHGTPRAIRPHHGEWSSIERCRDTGDNPWLAAAAAGRTALVDTPDFRHFGHGPATDRLDQAALSERYTELAPWFLKADHPVRRVEDCPFRNVSGGPQTATCELLTHWLGSDLASDLASVERDACEACCASRPPSRSELNPVVASLLVTACNRVMASGATDGSRGEQVAAVRDLAEDSLEITWDEPTPGLPARNAGDCSHFGPAVGFRPAVTPHGGVRTTVYQCRHPAHRETTPAECVVCRDWTVDAGVEPLALRDVLPVPAQRHGSKVKTWCVGVITAPRRTPTLDTCLDSLMRAGWERPRLFVDATTTVATRHAGVALTVREPRIGAFPNYYLALAEMVMRDPEADAYMLAEDDVIFFDREDLRAYMEDVLWPSDPVGAVSLYCSSVYTQASTGWHRFDGAWVWGALAFIFSPESARQFLCDPLIFAHRSANDEGLAETDALIGVWSHERSLPLYFPTPSLVQHIGDTSSLWPASRAFGHHRADRFAGDQGR